MSFKTVGQQQWSHAETGAVIEAVDLDAKHLVGLALVPGRPGEDRGEAG